MEIDLFDEIQKMRQQGRKAALATIVQIRGSVPSFQCAKMLVRDDGSTLGSVNLFAEVGGDAAWGRKSALSLP